MAFENLRNQHPLLLQYLTDHHYSTPLIDTVRREIARIIDLSDVEGWKSYADTADVCVQRIQFCYRR